MSTKPERASPADEFWGRTASCPRMSAIGGKADMIATFPNVRFDPSGHYAVESQCPLLGVKRTR